ncbi:hypothetical protein PCE1_003519 [Barthelona sp. PCE]
MLSRNKTFKGYFSLGISSISRLNVSNSMVYVQWERGKRNHGSTKHVFHKDSKSISKWSYSSEPFECTIKRSQELQYRPKILKLTLYRVSDTLNKPDRMAECEVNIAEFVNQGTRTIDVALQSTSHEIRAPPSLRIMITAPSDPRMPASSNFGQMSKINLNHGFASLNLSEFNSEMSCSEYEQPKVETDAVSVASSRASRASKFSRGSRISYTPTAASEHKEKTRKRNVSLPKPSLNVVERFTFNQGIYEDEDDEDECENDVEPENYLVEPNAMNRSVSFLTDETRMSILNSMDLSSLKTTTVRASEVEEAEVDESVIETAMQVERIDFPVIQEEDFDEFLSVSSDNSLCISEVEPVAEPVESPVFDALQLNSPIQSPHDHTVQSIVSIATDDMDADVETSGAANTSHFIPNNVSYTMSDLECDDLSNIDTDSIASSIEVQDPASSSEEVQQEAVPFIFPNNAEYLKRKRFSVQFPIINNVGERSVSPSENKASYIEMLKKKESEISLLEQKLRKFQLLENERVLIDFMHDNSHGTKDGTSILAGVIWHYFLAWDVFKANSEHTHLPLRIYKVMVEFIQRETHLQDVESIVYFMYTTLTLTQLCALRLLQLIRKSKQTVYSQVLRNVIHDCSALLNTNYVCLVDFEADHAEATYFSCFQHESIAYVSIDRCGRCMDLCRELSECGSEDATHELLSLSLFFHHMKATAALCWKNFVGIFDNKCKNLVSPLHLRVFDQMNPCTREDGTAVKSSVISLLHDAVKPFNDLRLPPALTMRMVESVLHCYAHRICELFVQCTNTQNLCHFMEGFALRFLCSGIEDLIRDKQQSFVMDTDTEDEEEKAQGQFNVACLEPMMQLGGLLMIPKSSLLEGDVLSEFIEALPSGLIVAILQNFAPDMMDRVGVEPEVLVSLTKALKAAPCKSMETQILSIEMQPHISVTYINENIIPTHLKTRICQ